MIPLGGEECHILSETITLLARRHLRILSLLDPVWNPSAGRMTMFIQMGHPADLQDVTELR